MERIGRRAKRRCRSEGGKAVEPREAKLRTSPSLEVQEANGLAGRRRFVDLPFQIFGGDPAWVPPLRLAVHDRLSPRHPANQHQHTQLWLAYRGPRAVARIGACVDRAFNDHHRVSWAWLGFFESVEDPEAAHELFQNAWEWARWQGADLCVGPASFTTNDECGLLVEGFAHRPTVLTPHNPPHYERLWVEAGWEPAADLWGWQFDRGSTALSPRQRRILRRLQARGGLRVRSLRLHDFDGEIRRFFHVYNQAWSRNWGFAPMAETEVRHLARSLKRLIDPELALFAEKPDGEPVGVALGLLDLNEPLQGNRSGRLLPLGWWSLLRDVPRASRARVLALGVSPRHQGRAVGPLLYEQLVDRLAARPNIQSAEASWVLASNTAMNGAIEAMGGRRHKTWRLYRRQL